MNPIKQQFELQKADYHIRYEKVLNSNPNKTHVLYIACYDNGTGLYSSIIPAVELNKTDTHDAIVNQIEPFTQQKQATGFDVHINDTILQWADYICFNTSFHDLKKDIDAIKQTNQKPNLKFVMHIDDFYEINQPGQNKQVAEKMHKQLLLNLNACDMVTTPSEYLARKYMQLLAEENLTSPHFFIQPNFMSNDCYQDVKLTKTKPSKIQIGLILNPTQFMDLAPMRKVLLHINKKHDDKAEIVIFGWNGKKEKPYTDAIQGVKYKHVKPVSINDYFSTLANLHLDFALMPLKDTEFNRCKSHHKLMQYAQIGVPAICSNVMPYTDILSPPCESIYQQGYLPAVKVNDDADDWIEKIEFMISNHGARKQMAEKANISVQENFTWHTNSHILTSVFANSKK